MPSQSAKSLKNWLERIESFHPKEIELGLDRIRIVAESLHCTQFECPVISVAGTNGKGSTVETLKQLALVKGLKVGTYTSPHLFEFNERIAINGQFVSDEVLINAFERIEQARTKNPENIIPLSFFEFTTLAAFVLFKEAKLDLVVLEVGLGGRLDAVNLVDADVAIITSIGIDHEAWLGNSREQIAIEKAGIARKNHICIVGDTNPPSNLQAHLLALGAYRLQVGQDLSFVQTEQTVEFFLAGFKTGATHLNNPSILLSSEKIKLAPENTILALQAFACLDWQLSEEEAQHALSQTALLGRFQVFELGDQGRVICDLTHNPAGASFFRKQVNAYLEVNPQLSSIHILMGVMADKDIEGIVNEFLDISDAWLVCDMPSERAAKSQDIKDLINTLLKQNHKVQSEIGVEAFTSIAEGLEQYLRTAKQDSCLLVLGSFFSVGPAIKILAN